MASGAAMAKTTLEAMANDFLALKRIAVAGVSADARRSAAAAIYRRLKSSGHEVFGLNPSLQSFDGDPCYPDVTSIPGGVDGVVIVTRPEATEKIVRQCGEVGVRRVWMHESSARTSSVSDEALAFCRSAGIAAIPGGCPMMFGANVDFGHRCMRWLLRLPAGRLAEG